MLADERDKGGARGLVFAFAPSRDPHPAGRNRARLRRRALAVASRTAGRGHVHRATRRERRSGCPGSSPSGLAVTGLSSVRLSTRSFGLRHRACRAVLPGRANRGRGQLAPVGRLDLELRPEWRETRRPGSAAQSPGPVRVRPDRSRRGGRDPRARPLSRAADCPPHRGRAAEQGVGRLRHSARPDAPYTRRESSFCSENKERQSDHRRGPSLTSPREPVRARPGSARKVGDVFKIDPT